MVALVRKLLLLVLLLGLVVALVFGNGRPFAPVAAGAKLQHVDEREVDRLYGLPLDEFTAERNELAKRLRADGEREAAEAVRALTKPTAAAWAVNQLARTNEVQVRALLRGGEKLREAQRRVLDGGDAAALRDAQRNEREVVARLTAQAAKLLPRASSSVLDRISETLRAAAVGDDDTRDLLKHGRLTRELELSGFAALAGMPVKSRTARRRGGGDDETARREREEKKRRLEKARERVTQARAAAREAEREAKRHERDAAKARAAADEAAAELARAEEELAALR